MKKPTLPTSCKQLCLKTMCDNGSLTNDPLTWNKDGATGECNSCPGLKVEVDKAISSMIQNISQQESKKQSFKDKKSSEMIEKYVFALYSHSLSLNDAILMLQESIPHLRKHVHTAHRQWQAHKTYRENLDECSIRTVEDYQMNIN